MKKQHNTLTYLHWEREDLESHVKSLLPIVNASTHLMVHNDATHLLRRRHDTLGIVLEGSVLLTYPASLPFVLKQQDVYVLKAHKPYLRSLRGASLELTMNSLWGGSTVIPASSMQTIAGYAGGSIKMMKNDEGLGNVHLIWVDCDKNIKKPHYHKQLTELYFVLQGTGRMQMSPVDPYQRNASYEKEFCIKPGTLVVVPPFTVHNSIADQGQQMTNQVIGLPRFFKKDMYWV